MSFGRGGTGYNFGDSEPFSQGQIGLSLMVHLLERQAVGRFEGERETARKNSRRNGRSTVQARGYYLPCGVMKFSLRSLPYGPRRIRRRFSPWSAAASKWSARTAARCTGSS